MDTAQLVFMEKQLAPEVSPEEVERLCDFLRGRGWLTSKQIFAEIALEERKIRAIAEHSDGRILSGPGCPGYKLFTGATEIAEADLCASRLEGQAKKMIVRAGSIRRRYHRYARNA
jgi:hypothetical protein